MSGFVITDETPYADPHSRGTGSIVTERKGYVLRTRGEHNRLVRHDYRCPVHGIIERDVNSGDVPDYMQCPVTVGIYNDPSNAHQCTEMMPWQYPTVAQGLSAGSVKS
jgi:hypothetical protein